MNTTRETFARTLSALTENATPLALNAATGIEGALESPASGTMRAWMESHNGQTVTTVQIDNRNGSGWLPTGRTIDARPSAVFLDRSAREYRGMKVLHATGSTLIVGDDWHTVAYIVE